LRLLVEDISATNANEWDSFLERQRIYHAFQSSQLLLALKENPYYTARGRVFRDIDRAGEIAAGYVFCVVQEVRGPASWLTTRVILNGGPVIALDYQACLSEVLDDLLSHPDMKGTYLELWHAMDRSGSAEIFEQKKFVFTPHLNYLIDLSKGHDEVWKNIQDRKRRYIKKNLSLLNIRPLQSAHELTLFYKILEETYQKIKLPLIDYSVFKDIYNRDAGLFFLAEKEGTAVAARVALKFGKSLYDWFAGSTIPSAGAHVNESMVWWVLSYGAQNGYDWFDFGGAGRPDQFYGVRDFKAEFGGTLVNFGRHKYILSPWKNQIFNSAIKARAWWIGRKAKDKLV
jgi:serine/alanine adding enzyme